MFKLFLIYIIKYITFPKH